MLHIFLLSALTTLLWAAPVLQDDASKQKTDKKADDKAATTDKNTDDKPAKDKELPKGKRRVGRPGDLTAAEEDKLDRLLDSFIAHDIGLRINLHSVQALKNMGPEAIPALIRALNKTAMMSNSCPVSMFQRKLMYLLSTSDDEEVLRYARSTIGTGVRRSPYEGLLVQLRVATSQRQAQLARLRQQEEKSQKGAKGNDSRYSKDK